MRSVSSAICTSGEPVSVSWSAVLGDRGRGVGHAEVSVFVLNVGTRQQVLTHPQDTTVPQTAKMRRVASTSAFICSMSGSVESNRS